MAEEALTWDNWNRKYKDEIIELMILLHANIGNPNVLNVDEIQIGKYHLTLFIGSK